MIVTDSTYLPVMTMAGQCLVALIFGEQLAQKVLRNRTPSPVILADWIGDSAVVITLVALILARIGEMQGWLRGASEYVTDSMLGLLVLAMPVYWWRGQRRVVLALTARAVAGRWPWSAGA